MMTHQFRARPATLGGAAQERILAVARSLGFGESDIGTLLRVFGLMSITWAERSSELPPTWSSDLTDDSSPYEISVALEKGRAELRILAEAYGEPPSVPANWRAARALTEALAEAYRLPLDRVHTIEDAFTPSGDGERFAAWHAACFRPGEQPEFKLYLNPIVSGVDSARDTIRETLSRLGFEGSTPLLRTGDDDVFVYLSLDLSGGDHARIKVYTAHFDATPERIERALQAVRGYTQGQVAEFCRVMGGGDGPFNERPIQTCLSFTQGSAAPTSGTVYFPVRSYARDDAEVRERMLGYIEPEAIPMYERALAAFANRPLDAGVGMQSYVSLRQAPSTKRVTVYMSPEVYAVRSSCEPAPISLIPRPTPSLRSAALA